MTDQPVVVAGHVRNPPGGGMAAPQATVPPPGAAPAPAGGGPMSQRWGPLPAWGWVALAAGGSLLVWFFFLRGRGTQNAATGTTSAQPSSTTTSADGCTDASGNAVPCGQADYSSQVAALQAEIDNLQGAGSTGTATGQTITVPNVTGKSLADAASALLSAGGWMTSVQGTGSSVASQSPAAGTQATTGTTVTLTTN